MIGQSPGLAGRYFAAMTLLTGGGLGAIVTAGITHPHAGPVLAPLGLLVGVALGYGWRDAAQEWRDHRAVIRLARAQEQRTKRLLDTVNAGVVPMSSVIRADTFLGAVPQPAD